MQRRRFSLESQWKQDSMEGFALKMATIWSRHMGLDQYKQCLWNRSWRAEGCRGNRRAMINQIIVFVHGYHCCICDVCWHIETEHAKPGWIHVTFTRNTTTPCECCSPLFPPVLCICPPLSLLSLKKVSIQRKIKTDCWQLPTTLSLH